MTDNNPAQAERRPGFQTKNEHHRFPRTALVPRLSWGYYRLTLSGPAHVHNATKQTQASQRCAARSRKNTRTKNVRAAGAPQPPIQRSASPEVGCGYGG